MLTDTQKSALEASIYEYLAASGYATAASALATESPSLVANPPPPPPPTGAASATTLLEKKWVAVVRLQKKVLELEARTTLSPSSAATTTTTGRIFPTTDLPSKLCPGHKGAGVNALSLHPSQTTGEQQCELSAVKTMKQIDLTHTKHRRVGGWRRAFLFTRVCCVAFFHACVWPLFTPVSLPPPVASAGSDGSVKLWDWEAGAYLSTCKGHTSSVNDVSYNCSGSLLASCSSDLSIKLWDAEMEYACVKTIRGHDHAISAVLFLPPSAAVLASASRDGTVKLWSVKTGFVQDTLTHHQNWVRALACSADGLLLASGGNDQVVTVVKVANKEVVWELKGHEHVVECLAFPTMLEKAGVGESMLVSGSRDKTVKVWNVVTGVCAHSFAVHDNWVRGVSIHRSRNYVISVGDDRTMRVFDVPNKRVLKTFEDAGEHFVQAVVAGERMNVVVTAGVDNVVKMWACR